MTNDKFILMGLDDERSTHVAEVLKNKTCKKILDFLAETKEASEKDISDGLDMPINTVEYNLKKLIKSGLVEKTKNFFWSVKGKKIPMYKLARKHIIISPSKKPSLNYIKSILPVIVIALCLVALVALFTMHDQGGDQPAIISENMVKQFSSQGELNEFIKENVDSPGFFEQLGDVLSLSKSFGGVRTAEVMETASFDSESFGGAQDYSTTNIQVEGVDEADIVKNDGKYIYVVSGSKIIIVDAFPAEEMNILSEIEFDEAVNQIYINEDKLIVLGGYWENSFVDIYDISDRENPEPETEIILDGNYINSRMIGDYVYIINNKYIDSRTPELPVFYADGIEEKVAAEEIYYFDYPDTSYVFTSISAININEGDMNNEVYLIGSAGNLYVSQDNIYLTYMKQTNFEEYVEEMAEEVYFPLLPNEYDEKIQKILDSDEHHHNKISEMRNLVNEYIDELEGEEFSDFSKELAERLEDFEIEIQKKNQY